jgi:hypothetical protein
MRHIAIMIVGTNAYKVLAYRFITNFMHFYTGHSKISFALFSDEDPTPYVDYPVDWYKANHSHWRDGTNSKYQNILDVQNYLPEYTYYFDADTYISRSFDADWFIGDLVGGEHYANQTSMRNKKGYERNPRSTCYVPLDTKLPQTYYYGAFWGGKTYRVIEMCLLLLENQKKDKEWGYEPGVNDESYLNQHFHYNPPTKVVPSQDFRFGISDKAGLVDMRNTAKNVKELLGQIAAVRGKPFNIRQEKVVLL